MSEFYVYAYLDPRKPGSFKYQSYHFDHEPIYIGKGRGARKYAHLYRTDNHPLTHKISRIRDTGSDPIIIEIQSSLLEEDAYLLEMLLITELGMHREGILCNLCSGGGLVGYTHSKETKEKMRRSYYPHEYSKETRDKIRASKLGRPRSDETRRKISLSLKGNKPSEDTRRKLSKAGRNRVLTPLHKKRISESNRGFKHSKESKRKMSESKRGRSHSLNHKFQVLLGRFYPVVDYLDDIGLDFSTTTYDMHKYKVLKRPVRLETLKECLL